MGLLHVILRDGLEDAAFIAAHTTGFDAVRAAAEPWDPAATARLTGVPPAAIERAAHWIGESRRVVLMHARGIEHQSKGVDNVLSLINLALATGNIGRPGAGSTMITGQGNGQGGREHGQKCDQLPGQRSTRGPRGARARGEGVGRLPRRDPAHRLHRDGDHGGHPPRRDQGAVVDLLQPAGVAPRRRLRAHRARAARVVLRHRLLPLRDGAPRRRGARRQPAGRGRRRHLQRRGARPPHPAAPSTRRARRVATARSSASSVAASAAPSSSPSSSRARSSTSCARPRAAASPTTTASPTRRSTASSASSGPARARTTPARRASSKATASSTPTARRASSSPSTARAATR